MASWLIHKLHTEISGRKTDKREKTQKPDRGDEALRKLDEPWAILSLYVPKAVPRRTCLIKTTGVCFKENALATLTVHKVYRCPHQCQAAKELALCVSFPIPMDAKL